MLQLLLPLLFFLSFTFSFLRLLFLFLFLFFLLFHYSFPSPTHLPFALLSRPIPIFPLLFSSFYPFSTFSSSPCPPTPRNYPYPHQTSDTSTASQNNNSSRCTPCLPMGAADRPALHVARQTGNNTLPRGIKIHHNEPRAASRDGEGSKAH